MLADVKNGGFSAEIEKYTAANSKHLTIIRAIAKAC